MKIEHIHNEVFNVFHMGHDMAECKVIHEILLYLDQK